MSKFIGKVICYFKGHRRGKLVSQSLDTRDGKRTSTYACGRCGRRSVYKVKVPT